MCHPFWVFHDQQDPKSIAEVAKIMGKMFLFVLHLIFIVVAAMALGGLSLNVHQVSFSLIGSAFADIHA